MYKSVYCIESRERGAAGGALKRGVDLSAWVRVTVESVYGRECVCVA